VLQILEENSNVLAVSELSIKYFDELKNSYKESNSRARR